MGRREGERIRQLIRLLCAGIQTRQTKVLFLLLSRKNSCDLPSGPDLSLPQLVPGLGLADRRGRLVCQDPRIYPLRPGAERPRDYIP